MRRERNWPASRWRARLAWSPLRPTPPHHSSRRRPWSSRRSPPPKRCFMGKGNDVWEMLVENVPWPRERNGARRRIRKTRRPFDAHERARRSLRSNQHRCEAADSKEG